MSNVAASKYHSSPEVVEVADSVAFVVADAGQTVHTAGENVAAVLVVETCFSAAEIVVNVLELDEKTENSSLLNDQWVEASCVQSVVALSVECVDVLAGQHLF